MTDLLHKRLFGVLLITYLVCVVTNKYKYTLQQCVCVCVCVCACVRACVCCLQAWGNFRSRHTLCPHTNCSSYRANSVILSYRSRAPNDWEQMMWNQTLVWNVHVPTDVITFMPLWKSFPTDLMQPSGRWCLDSHLLASLMCWGCTKMYGVAPPKDFITKEVSLQGHTHKDTHIHNIF